MNVSRTGTKPGPALSDRWLLVIAAWTALWLGLVEAWLMAAARFGLGRYTHVSAQGLWTTPVWHLVGGLLLACTVLVLWRSRSRTRAMATLFMPAWLGTTGILFLLSRVHPGAAILLAAGISLQYARFVAARPELSIRIVRRTLAVPAALVVAAFISLNGSRLIGERSGSDAVQANAGQTNVLLIILDTVRAASLSLYGSERETTPNLSAFAQRGIVFDNAYSVSPWTLPSHATMFTGLLPPELSADWRSPLNSEPVTLAEVLRERGYRTAGFVANTFYGSRESGLARGFQRYEAYPIWSPGHFLTGSSIARALMRRPGFRRALRIDEVPGRRKAPSVTAGFLDWLEPDSDRPWFAFLNYFDAHAPYLPPPPYDTLYGPLLPGRDPSMETGRGFTPAELRAEIDAYDGAIAYLDHHLGSLLDTLEARGTLANTLVIITSDHGEEFGEHEVFTHGNSLYDEVLHVPLIAVMPGYIPDGRRVQRWVSIRDIPATIMDMANTGVTLPGQSLARHWDGGDREVPVDTLTAFVSYASGRPVDYPVSRGDMASVMAEPFRFIMNGDSTEELYDRSLDSAEARNIIADPGNEHLSGLLRRHVTDSGWLASRWPH